MEERYWIPLIHMRDGFKREIFLEEEKIKGSWWINQPLQEEDKFYPTSVASIHTKPVTGFEKFIILR